MHAQSSEVLLPEFQHPSGTSSGKIASNSPQASFDEKKTRAAPPTGAYEYAAPNELTLPALVSTVKGDSHAAVGQVTVPPDALVACVASSLKMTVEPTTAYLYTSCVVVSICITTTSKARVRPTTYD